MKLSSLTQLIIKLLYCTTLLHGDILCCCYDIFRLVFVRSRRYELPVGQKIIDDDFGEYMNIYLKG